LKKQKVQKGNGSEEMAKVEILLKSISSTNYTKEMKLIYFLLIIFANGAHI